jgi:hypothetical protein
MKRRHGRPRKLCPSCGSEHKRAIEFAVVAPWIRSLASVRRRTCRLFRCQSCQSAWFDLDYTEAELHKIYSDYRGGLYVALRNHWEGYTIQTNNILEQESDFQEERRHLISTLVEKKFGIDFSCIGTVVDYAGAHGVVINKWTQIEKRYVVEVSKAKVLPGISRVDRISEISSPIHLLLFLGILEHVGDPTAFLRSRVSEVVCHMKRFPSQGHPIFVFEVPSGAPRKRRLLSFPISLVLSINPISWRLANRSSVFERLFGSPLRVAEHLQFFTSEGIKKLLDRAGLDFVHLEEYSMDPRLGSLGFCDSQIVIATLKIPDRT